MKYFLSKRDQVEFEERARNSFLAEEPLSGFIRLFNKNAGETLHVRLVDTYPDRCAYIVECDTVPEYFKNVLIPLV